MRDPVSSIISVAVKDQAFFEAMLTQPSLLQIQRNGRSSAQNAEAPSSVEICSYAMIVLSTQRTEAPLFPARTIRSDLGLRPPTQIHLRQLSNPKKDQSLRESMEWMKWAISKLQQCS